MNSSMWKVFLVFLKKSLKEKIYYKWRNIFFIVLPIVLTLIIGAYPGESHSPTNSTNDSSATSSLEQVEF